MKYTKMYLVCWMKGKELDKCKDKYRVFTDMSSKWNRKNAKDFYKLLLKSENVFSANICEIIKSTDYV